MSKVKTILIWLMAILVVGYVIGMGIWSSKRANMQLCPGIEMTITDLDERQYVTVEELALMLQGKGLYPVKKPIATISTEAIERAVTAHPMVRKAECWTTQAGTVCVRLSQRIPVLRVVSGDDSYFVDIDRTRMPIQESVTTPVLVVEGNVGERMAKHELADLAMWIYDNPYWQEKITSIYVVNPKMVYLIQKPDETHLILGEVSGFRRKLGKLRTLYDKGFEQIGWRTYKEIDLRYTGQVVGRN
ncbi:MAG: hypothetical protein IKT19_00735 [Paludibacteraceae bacterium]|nr:hypothetical protein [Paludibacteraceae bacterium]